MSPPRWVLFCSLAAAAAAMVVSALGLALPELAWPEASLRQSYHPTELANLVCVLPLLLGALALRGRRAAQLIWPGALFALAYAYAPYLSDAHASPLLVIYALIVVLCCVALAGLLSQRQAPALSRPQGTRLGAGVLLALGGLLLVRQAAMAATDQLGPSDRGLWLADTLLATPALLLVGTSLWRRRPLGMRAGPGLLAAYGVLCLGLELVLPLTALSASAPMPWVDMAVIALMGGACLAPLVPMARS